MNDLHWLKICSSSPADIGDRLLSVRSRDYLPKLSPEHYHLNMSRPGRPGKLIHPVIIHIVYQVSGVVIPPVGCHHYGVARAFDLHDLFEPLQVVLTYIIILRLISAVFAHQPMDLIRIELYVPAVKYQFRIFTPGERMMRVLHIVPIVPILPGTRPRIDPITIDHGMR